MAYALDFGGHEGTGRVRPDDYAGDQQPEDRAQAEMPEHGHRNRGNDQQQHCGVNERFGVHGTRW